MSSLGLLEANNEEEVKKKKQFAYLRDPPKIVKKIISNFLFGGCSLK